MNILEFDICFVSRKTHHQKSKMEVDCDETPRSEKDLNRFPTYCLTARCEYRTEYKCGE